MKKIALCLILAGFSFLGCEDDPEVFEAPDNRYFPLQVGNYWKFQTVYQEGPNNTLEREIVNFTTVGDREYAVMVQTSISSTYEHRDTLYYRVDGRGYVFLKSPSTNGEINSFRLADREGESWKVPYGESEIGKISYSSGLALVNQTQLDSCKTFSFDVKEVIDEESWTILAPGVGTVVMGSMWMQYHLKEAVIDGKTYKF